MAVQPKRSTRKRSADGGGPDSEVVTTVRIRRRHWMALHTAAMERAAERGGGRSDASEVLREVLDAWVKANG